MLAKWVLHEKNQNQQLSADRTVASECGPVQSRLPLTGAQRFI